MGNLMLLALDAKENTVSHEICCGDEFQNLYAIYKSGAP